VVSSDGTLPDSVAVYGDLVHVANSGTGDSNYTGFRLGFTGRLDPIPRIDESGMKPPGSWPPPKPWPGP
jgi:hypothetical protein